MQICCIPVIKFSSRTVSGKRNLAANGFSPGAPDSYVEEKTDQNIKQNNKRHLLILFCRDLFKSILGNPGQSVGPGEKERRKFSSTGELTALIFRDTLRGEDQFAVCFAICVFFTDLRCRALLELATELISGCYHCFCCSILNFIYLSDFVKTWPLGFAWRRAQPGSRSVRCPKM